MALPSSSLLLFLCALESLFLDLLGPVYDFEGFANQLALCDVSLEKSEEVLFMGLSYMDGVTTA